MHNKKVIIISSIVLCLVVLGIATSYALYTFNVTGDTIFRIGVGNLELSISDNETDDVFIMENVYPVKDEVGLSQDGYTFTVTNTGSLKGDYSVYLDDVVLENETHQLLSKSLVKFNLVNNETGVSKTDFLTNFSDSVIDSGTLEPNESVTYTLKMWVDYNAGNEAQNKYFAARVRIDGTQASPYTYRSVDDIINSFDENELKAVIMCNNFNNSYGNCNTYESIDSALLSRSNGLIILTEDLYITNTITIPQTHNIQLDLNGKIISFIDKGITNYGILNIINGNLESNVSVLALKEDSVTNIKDVQIISSNVDNASAICNNGKLLIDGNTKIEGVYAIGCHNSNKSETIINGGTLIGTLKNAIQANNGNYTSNISINNGYIEGNNAAVSYYGIGVLSINGGIFIGKNGHAIILSDSDSEHKGEININQQMNPIYISSKGTSGYKSGINNSSNGIISINGDSADKCTENYLDTTSGLCIYTTGDKNFSSDTSGAAVINSSTGTININGGTYYGGYYGISNHQSGIINIRNADIYSGNRAIGVGRSSKNYIYNSLLNANSFDIVVWAESTSSFLLQYSENVKFTNNTNTPIVSKPSYIVENVFTENGILIHELKQG